MMNNWPRNDTNRMSSLRESLVNSSAASLRTPLPIIIQNERNDEVLSNRSRSVEMNSQQEFEQEEVYQYQHKNNGIYHYQQEGAKQYHYFNRNYSNMMRKSMGLFNSNMKDSLNMDDKKNKNASYSYRNYMEDKKHYDSNFDEKNNTDYENKYDKLRDGKQLQLREKNNYGDKNIKQKKKGINLIKQTTNLQEKNYLNQRLKASKNKIHSNLRDLYCSQSSSSKNIRPHSKEKPIRNTINSKQRLKQKYPPPSSAIFINRQSSQKNRYRHNINNEINRELNKSYMTNINAKTNRSFENITPVVTKPALNDSYMNVYARGRNQNRTTSSSSNSQSNSNSDEIFIKNKSKDRYKQDMRHNQRADMRINQKNFWGEQKYKQQSQKQQNKHVEYEDVFDEKQDRGQQQNRDKLKNVNHANNFKRYQNVDNKYKHITHQRDKNVSSKDKKNVSSKDKKNDKSLSYLQTLKQDKIKNRIKQRLQSKNQLTNSKKWISSVRSFVSLNFDSSSNSHRNSTSNFKNYLNENLVNSRASESYLNNKNIYESVVKNNSIEEKKISHYSKHQSHQSSHQSRHSFTNSKRLLTTNKHSLDRRQYIVCIIEYCSNQVGIACYNIKTGQICLTQIIERMTYLRTVSTLQRFYPQEIIFSSTLQNTLLMRKLMNIFKRTSFRPIKRALFDETKGYYIYTQRGNKNENNPDHKFLAYAALNALLVTMESTFQFTVTYSALNIKWHFLQEVLVIDSQTVADLQIFINKETKIIKNTFIDNFKCLTDGGTRMLRANILQPLTDIGTINERVLLVEFFLQAQNKGILDLLMKELVKFKNYEAITAKFIQNPKSQNIRSIKIYLHGILMLSRMCFQLENLQKKVASIIQNFKISDTNPQISSILSNVYVKLSDPRVEEIRKIIQQNFDEQILKNYQNLPENQINTVLLNNRKNKNKQVRGSSNTRLGVNRNANLNKKDSFIFVFKLEKIQDEFAQISRLTYSHTIEDILKIFEQIKQKIKSQHNIKLLYNQHRGYYMSGKYSCPSGQLDLTTLSNIIQDDIIHINTKNNTITFTSSILISLNNRLKQNQSKLIYQSTELLLSVIKQIQKKMQILFQINYWISVLDMVIGFVSFVKFYQSEFKVAFCKPKFLKNHKDSQKQPILKISKLRTIWTMQKFQKLSSDISIQLVSGTYCLVIHKQLNSFDQLNILYSIGFMTILAQIGCLVPAEQFLTSIYEVLISKMEVQGNLENKMSHFQMQLASLRNILQNVAERQTQNQKKQNNNASGGRFLVLIDEICKGTKPSEQYALSIAAVEQIIFKKQQKNNVSIILVSDYKLFNMLGELERLSLCQFSLLEEQHEWNQQLTNQQRNLLIKQKSLIQCISKYNFDESFLEIYRQLPTL